MSDLLTGGQSFVAGGTINPATFVKLSTATVGQVLNAGANGRVYGVCQNFPNSYQVSGSAEPAAATVGQEIMVFTAPSRALLTLGTGGCTVDDLLESDANGNGVTSSVATHNVGAKALQSGSAGDVVQVLLLPPNSTHP